MRKNNIDPIVYYNIPQTDEEGKYTNGPVELSVVKNNLLQPLADQGDTFLLGIKIATNRKQGFGDGKLVTMTNLHLSLPPGFELARDGSRYDCGNYEFEVYPGADCIADCTRLMKGERCIADCNNYNNYRLKAADSNNISAGVLPKIKEEGKEFVKLPLQIPCYVKTKSSQSILKTSKFVMENFRATADYDFEISVAKPFKIQEKQGYVNAEKLADFCGFKTSYINSSLITKDNVNSLISRSAELINDSKVSFSGSTVCSQLIKAIVVYKNRNGVENNMGYGITGITEEQLDYSYQWPTNLANVETQHQDITLTSNYLKYALSHECTIDGQQNLDCALGYYFCNSGTGSCVETVAPIVIQIAKALSTP
jgi:hypothetical protein